jgi:hypothetical protein
LFASPKLLLFWDVSGGMIHYVTSKLTVFILGMTFWYNYCGHNAIPAEQNLGCGVCSREGYIGLCIFIMMIPITCVIKLVMN